MTITSYVLLNEQFCLANAGYETEKGIFGYGITTMGDYVASAQTVDDFPELFEGELVIPGIVIIELQISDFPPITPPA